MVAAILTIDTMDLIQDVAFSVSVQLAKEVTHLALGLPQCELDHTSGYPRRHPHPL